MNWYLITNLLSGLAIIIFIFCVMFIEKKNYKKIEIKQLTVISSLVALSAVLTNAIGYSIQIPIAGSNIMLALGEWLLFVIGFVFGPFLGVIAAISTDLIGSMISIGGFPYHAGYMLDKVLIAFMGGLILIRGNKNLLTLKIILSFSFAYIMESLIFNPIWQYSVTPDIGFVFANFTIKLIKLPISIFIYSSLILLTMPVMMVLVNKYFDERVWAIKNGNWQFLYAEFRKNTYRIKHLVKKN